MAQLAVSTATPNPYNIYRSLVKPSSFIQQLQSKLSYVCLDAARFYINENRIRKEVLAASTRGKVGYSYKTAEYTFWFSGFDGFWPGGPRQLRFSLNPSKFKSYADYLQTLSILFYEIPLKARVSRLDCSVTLPIIYQDMLVGMDFGLSRSYVDKYDGTLYSGRRRKKSLITFYDKTKEAHLDYPATRIEMNSFPKAMALETLPLIMQHRPFESKKVSHNNLVFIDPGMDSTPAKRTRFTEFKDYVQEYGFWLTRKKINKEHSGNFSTQYRGFYKLEPIKPTLDDLFQEGIKPWFEQSG